MVKQFGFTHTTQPCCGGNHDETSVAQATRVRTEVNPGEYRLDAIEVDCADDACSIRSALPVDEAETADEFEVRLSDLPSRGCKEIRFECNSNCGDLTLILDPEPSEGDAEIAISHEESGFKLAYEITLSVMFSSAGFVVKRVIVAGSGSSCL